MRYARLITLSLLFFLLCTATYTPSRAQIPNLRIAFDEYFWSNHGFCPGPGAALADTIAVVARNFNMYMSTVEFGIEPPTINAAYVGDVHLDGALALGNSTTTGVWITYPSPLNAFSPVVVMRIAIMWLYTGCEVGNEEFIRVLPNQSSGLLRAVEWETYRSVEGYGDTSTICVYVGTEQSTWGKVKALYR